MSTDAFAAAVGRGASHRPTFAHVLRAGAALGMVEALTPLIGWALGLLAAGFVEQVDHWIAFALRSLVGGKMIWEASTRREEDGPKRSGRWALVATAIGTSIDAAAVGVGLAFIGADIWMIAASIGLSTFVLTTLGMLIGTMVGARLGEAAEPVGEFTQITIVLPILMEHLAMATG